MWVFFLKNGQNDRFAFSPLGLAPPLGNPGSPTVDGHRNRVNSLLRARVLLHETNLLHNMLCAFTTWDLFREEYIGDPLVSVVM